MRQRGAIELAWMCLLILVAAAPAAAQTPQPQRLFLPLVLRTGGPAVFTASADATIFENRDAITGALPYMIVGYDGDETSMGGIARSLIRFDLPGVNPAAIRSANLRVYYLAAADFENEPRTITVKQALGGWEEMDVRWSVRPPAGPVVSSIVINSNEDEGYREFDVTHLVKDWLIDAAANNGVYLLGPEEGGSDWAYRVFLTREAVSPPQLVIDWH